MFRRREGDNVPLSRQEVVPNFSSCVVERVDLRGRMLGFTWQSRNLRVLRYILLLSVLRGTNGKVWITTQISSPSSLQWIASRWFFSRSLDGTSSFYFKKSRKIKILRWYTLTLSLRPSARPPSRISLMLHLIFPHESSLSTSLWTLDTLDY